MGPCTRDCENFYTPVGRMAPRIAKLESALARADGKIL